MVPVPVPVPAPYLDHKKQIFKKNFGNFFDFLLSKLFYKEKVHEFQQIYGKMWMKKMFNEGNQIHNFMSSSGSGTVINYGSGSGSNFWTSYGSYGSGSGPVPQHWNIGARKNVQKHWRSKNLGKYKNLDAWKNIGATEILAHRKKLGTRQCWRSKKN
jgi:hypothetical protein